MSCYFRICDPSIRLGNSRLADSLKFVIPLNMMAPLEIRIGLRYTRARRRNNYISFISMISVLGIVIGVWALITVLSVMNGCANQSN